MLNRRPFGRGSVASDMVTLHKRCALPASTSTKTSPVHFHFLGILNRVFQLIDRDGKRFWHTSQAPEA